jgi:hypothetical protein
MTHEPVHVRAVVTVHENATDVGRQVADFPLARNRLMALGLQHRYVFTHDDVDGLLNETRK